ncbi:MAG TPA: heparan-alpha-glucosaminide N-acetyltransferase domain-containing protein [Vicinamibacterales bacterium]|nr:heparan-alpha-glucosaminide N-acetyltransferase domain-containing protein [Vicinamibacterales bacterium]
MNPVPLSVPSRLLSLDVFRGATMAAMVIVNTPGDWANVYWPLLHAEWHGWTPTDLIFPFFVFIVGVSIVLSKKSSGAVGPVIRRAAVIFGLGLLLALYPRFDITTVRIMGVLQRLALCYLAAVVIYRLVADRDERTRFSVVLGAAAALLAGYWILLTVVPVPGGQAGDLSPSGNLGAWIDRTLLGEAHLWRQSKTWDPEGLLSTLPALGTALTGITAGMVLVSAREPSRKIAILVTAGLILTISGWIWGVAFPINKNLWTSSYVLFTSGLAAIFLALCYWIVDLRHQRTLARPFVVMGVNALVLFVVSGWLVKTLIWIKVSEPAGPPVTLYRWIYAHAFEPLAPPKIASLLFASAALLLLYTLLEVMYRRRWFVRA